MKNSLDGFTMIEPAERRIKKHEETSTEIIQSKEQIKKNEQK